MGQRIFPNSRTDCPRASNSRAVEDERPDARGKPKTLANDRPLAVGRGVQWFPSTKKIPPRPLREQVVDAG